MNEQIMASAKSFILRIWNEEVDPQKQPKYRYVLVDAEGSSRQGFTSLDKLFLTLYQEISGDQSIKLLSKGDPH